MTARIRSWLHDGQPIHKAKAARIRDLEAKADIVVEYAIGWRKRTVNTEELESVIDDLIRCRDRADPQVRGDERRKSGT